jgi:hypothetical protein
MSRCGAPAELRRYPLTHGRARRLKILAGALMHGPARLKGINIFQITQGLAGTVALGVQQLDELAENLIAELGETFNAARCLITDDLRIDRALEAGDFSAILKDVQPDIDCRDINLQMKLKGIDISSISKGLVCAERRRSQMNASPGKVECIPVPLKNFLRTLYMAKQRVIFCGYCRCKVIPSNFFNAVWIDPGTESAGDELGAQAYS